MSSGFIATQEDFEALCDEIRAAGLVAFDTEFVSEHTYRPELCLLQFSVNQKAAVVDPFEVPDLSSWWKLMADEDTTIVVHGGQAEIRFCLNLGGDRPRRLVDVQIAEGLRSTSYPLGYEGLVNRVLGKQIHGKETRTDWRRRPLSPHQIRYALEDVENLLPIWQRQKDSLVGLGRLEWAEAEFERMISDLQEEAARETWMRLPGIHRLRPRERAVARALSHWREQEAARRDKPLRRILRDDLIIELARRQPKTVKDLLATRDMNRTDYRKAAEGMLQAIEQALDMPDDDLPGIVPAQRQEKNPDEHVLGQLLAIALSNRCVEMNVAKQIVGTSADLRYLVRYHMNEAPGGPVPRLATGWRAEVCGDLLTNLLDGNVSLRVADPQSDHPLVFEKR